MFEADVPADSDTPEPLVQAPAAVKSLRVIDEPLHTELAPPIPDGFGLTVTIAATGTPATV